jgi:flavorubredoxin
MPAVEINPGLYWIGVNDRTTDLFEGLWPVTSEGVSYNTYIIRDKKKVIIDLVKAIKTDDFFTQIDEVMPVSDVDYVVLNHMEPDHTGVINTLKKIAPQVTILGSEKMATMLKAYYGISEGVQVVKDGEILPLGDRSLQFFYTPFVHWPETIMTYEKRDGILFSCDAFGSYGALRGAVFDDKCLDLCFYETEALRYYANIVASFSKPVLKAIDKLSGLNISTICPSHGLIWRHNPEHIVTLYKKWAGYAEQPAETGITLLYGSMYGNTEAMMDAVAQGISRTGIPLNIFDVARTHVSYILPSLWEKRAVVVGAPTYETKLFPPMARVLEMAVLKRIRFKKAAYFGSYGWSGGAFKQMTELLAPIQWEITDSYKFEGGVFKDNLVHGEEFGEKFARSIKEEK